MLRFQQKDSRQLHFVGWRAWEYMRAARSLQPIVFAPRAGRADDAVTLLGEIVAQLAERVELLETRERIGRVPVSRRQAGSAKGRE